MPDVCSNNLFACRHKKECGVCGLFANMNIGVPEGRTKPCHRSAPADDNFTKEHCQKCEERFTCWTRK